MGYTIVSGNKPSSVPLHQIHAILFIEMKCFNKCQISIWNLKMPKIKWDGAEEATINNFYKIDYRKFWIRSLKCGSTEANRSISYEPK